ncbi:hypothetical protein SAMN05444000_14411 [Shimia gijangensis]|uniref:Uncharacterized protein n=1 Tax=Shimia gijangensis TaxID=1470563 RepID=A0A1M6TS77_9RHOB|nr:hypothetical protein [Shimia gijangensis]SHK59774.1 hypothetical protein SAMN05444000_14411 [Shimia gijangensis]
MRSIFSLTCVALLASCAQFPEVDQVTSQDIGDATYPDLIPVKEMAEPGPGYLDENSASNLEGRLNGLNRRADELRNRPIE